MCMCVCVSMCVCVCVCMCVCVRACILTLYTDNISIADCSISIVVISVMAGRMERV